MAAPNIVNVTTITGKTAVQAIGTSATAAVTCAANKVVKVNAILVANVDGSAAYTVNVDIYRGTTATRLAHVVTVPAAAALDILSKSIYLEEGDSLRFTANSANKLEAVVSYEEIGAS